MALADVSLDDKYLLERGRLFISGAQALVRLPLMQRRRDRAAGLNTAGFISGYRGSPLGAYDDALWQAAKHLEREDIVFRPGVNEELAATSVWGSQQAGLFPKPRHDGVFSIWYGKGPGVDRAGDALKHGNFAGTAPHGGVLVLAGDDHAAKSSTTAHQSDQALAAAMIPILNPSSVQDILDYGIYGWALSRFAGVWAGMVCVTDVVESGGSASADPEAIRIVDPPVERPPDGWHIRLQFRAQAEEQLLIRWRLPAVHAFVRANGLDKVVLDGPRRQLGLIAAGKSYADTRQALADLDIDDARAAALGVALYKPALTWPLEPSGLRAFAEGRREVLVLEEKRSFVEAQAAEILFNSRVGLRPDLSGKRDPSGAPLLAADGELSPAIIALAIGARMEALGLTDAALEARLRRIRDRVERQAVIEAPPIVRAPAFCSGCPHSTSTKLPEGSLALAGIGCHTMAYYLPDRPTAPPTQMGGEGANWIGAAPFSGTPHVFQNLGDGTYFHSGLIAIRAAIAAGVNITYKILFNDAVAMTGGQPVDGVLTPQDIVRQLRAEGVKRIALVTDDPGKYGTGAGLEATLHHRDDLLAVEEELRELPGVTALVYDQTCAAEKRRRRKQGRYPDPPKRYFINDLVCEGCGDCSVQSNCVSILPLETAFGRKRAIDQSSCNKDYSCVKGFCPSFVTVTGGRPRRAAAVEPARLAAELGDLPQPQMRSLERPYSILVGGIGGTGVVTIGALLGMAAHLDGLECSLLDVTGLSQKNGAVFSHVKLGRSRADLAASRIGLGETDLLLGCDLLVGGGGESLKTLEAGRARAVVNSHLVPTAEFQQKPDMDFKAAGFQRGITRAVGEAAATFVDATTAARRLFGDSIAANMFLTGYAWQLGLLPVSGAAILRAIEMNGVAAAMNTAAFTAGRAAAHDPHRIAALTDERPPPAETTDPLAALVRPRVEFLAAYQDSRYAEVYRAFIEKVGQAEHERATAETALSLTVARNLFKLMAYKDEYEVARLHSDGSLQRKLEAAFEGDYRLAFNLAPPLFARKDKATGEPRKMRLGPWMMQVFQILAALKGLRGTPLDPFGLTAERRIERELAARYRTNVERLIAELTPQNHSLAVEIAAVPEKIRGYGHIKQRHLAAAMEAERGLWAQWPAGAATVLAAE